MNQDFAEMLSTLNACGVKYMIVGSYATAYHGYTRATKDLDLWVSDKPDNGRQLHRALAEYGVPGKYLETFEEFLKSGQILQIGVAPNRIDIVTQLPGVRFEECWRRKEKTEYGGQRVYVISFDDHIKNKTATGRDQDRLDIKMLRKRHSDD